MGQNHLIWGREGVEKKVNFKRKICLCYLAIKKIKWRKIYCFGERGGEKNNWPRGNPVYGHHHELVDPYDVSLTKLAKDIFTTW